MTILKISLTALLLTLLSCSNASLELSPEQAARLPKNAQSLCGSSQIIGTKEKTISQGRCGISKPVKVYAVSGVWLSTPALMNCNSAKALNNWVETSLIPNAKALDEKVEEITNFQSYACRNRNNAKNGRLSEHAKGNAIDIGGFTLESGTKITVLRDYYKTEYNQFFSNIRKGACESFNTVLGPGSNRFHKDHFHFDAIDGRQAKYCR